MRALTAEEVISVWELTRGRKALRLALECLACAAPERSREQWSSLPFGRVCQALFQLRALMFGPAMPCMISCPNCGERLEFRFEYQSIPVLEDPPANALPIESNGRKIEIRLPTAADLLDAHTAADLLSRCALSPIAPDAGLIDAASACVAEADPLSEAMLDLECPACRHGWQSMLDVVAYFAHEVSHEAQRLLGEVHRLASAYGWREEEILALSPARRRAYLELAGA